MQAEKVKVDTPVLVILGNPPYNAFAGVSPAEEQGLVEPYKQGLISEWGIKKFNLDDLYIRFFRIAERRITKTGRGVVSFISNYSWTKEPSFVVLRKRLLEVFDKFWIENLHGNRKISEYAPDGRTSETIFAMPGFSPGIRQGVMTSLWVKRGTHRGAPEILCRDDISDARAADRRAHLLATLSADEFDEQFVMAEPAKDNRYRLWPSKITAEYKLWPRVIDLCAEAPSNGLMEKRGGTLIDIGRTALATRIQAYFDPSVSLAELVNVVPGLAKDAARFPAQAARIKLIKAEEYIPANLRRYAVRPFDYQWCYYTRVRPIWNEPRPKLWSQAWKGNTFFLSRLRSSSSAEGVPCYYVTELSDDHLIVPDASCVPIRLRKHERTSHGKENSTGHLFEGPSEIEDAPTANLSPRARAYLCSINISNPDYDETTAALIWMHALAITYAPAYLAENADGVGQDWPRVPLPGTEPGLHKSAELGRKLASLLNPDLQVNGITCGTIRAELLGVGSIRRRGGGNLLTGDLYVTAGWGHHGKDGVTAPGKGKTREREYSKMELSALYDGAVGLGITLDDILARIGRTTCDVYLNDAAFWENIPAKAWSYAIGGYQVLKKWLAYREKDFLNRELTIEEAEYVTEVARRITAMLILGPALDANYAAVKAATFSWASEG